ncbi:beta-1,4 N-acetylgalactosaminyltransferase 2-like [Pelodytes ibericus]
MINNVVVKLTPPSTIKSHTDSHSSLLKPHAPDPFSRIVHTAPDPIIKPSFYSEEGCSCEKTDGITTYQLMDYLNKDEIDSIKDRKMKEIAHFQKRYSSNKEIIIAQPNSPLSYPIQGIQVLPLHTIQMKGLSVHTEDIQNYKVVLSASLGIFNTFADVSEEQVKGRENKTLIITTPYLELVNHILHHLTYTSIEFNTKAVDIVTFQMGKYVAEFPVEIKQQQIPVLFDSGPDQKIRSLVTITTKTFLRYNKLRALIRSIRQFYPDIKIIVADDNKNLEKIEDPNVEQYFMPFAKGWFAGRNLAVSQVTTKYIMWVDDDFLFTERTKIEKLVEVLEKTDLDVVGGSVDGNDYKFKLLYQKGDGNGDCLHRRKGHYHKLEGFPNCVIGSGVVNMFVAHTRQILAVGFDPKLSRVAHSEFFFDGFGTLRVGSCNDVVVGHQKKTQANTEAERDYAQFRQNKHPQVKFKLGLLYFKNNLKCYTQN